MSKVSVLVGLQWGDEGKGKVVDLLSPQYNVVARYQGGANAGHTIVFNDKKYVLHLIPAGIFSENIICVIGNGVVLDFVALLEEMSLIKSEGISFEGRLFISRNLHIIMPYHKIIDAIYESGNNKIGTTKKGIGPAYYDKYARRGIKLHKNEDIIHVMNRSVNATLSRTIITSGTVFLTILVIFLFGGEVLRSFSFTFGVGIITGTYSSVFVASAVVVDWKLRIQKKGSASGKGKLM